MDITRKENPSATKTQLSPETFPGFPQAGFKLLAELKKHNDRDWFLQHKSEYQQHVHQPMEALVQAVAAECKRLGLTMYPKERNPVMRVYRDVRFSKDKTPYKTHVAAELKRSFAHSDIMLYLHISPEESFVAGGMWQPERPVLHAWRNALVDEPKRFEKMIADLRKGGLELSSEYALASMPRGFQNSATEWFAPLLKLTSFIVRRPLSQAQCMQAELVQAIVDFALSAKPLFQFGWRLEEP